METVDAELAAALRLAIAALIGLAVGLEREWSGHASGPDARFAGLRTFFLIGLLGGVSGLLVRGGYEVVAAAIVAGSAALAVSAYVMAIRQDGTQRDGTTEAAALVVLALGVIAGAVSLLVAAGAASFVVLALSEKRRLHSAVQHVREEELRAGLQFAVLALVILPVIPEGPFLGWAGIRPRTLWMIVLLFCAMNFAAFLARRSASEGRGYLLTGLLGGVISSTAVTFGFARYSRLNPPIGGALASGVVAACTALVPRVLIISAVINPPVAVSLLPLVVPAALIGIAVTALAWRYEKSWQAQGDEAATPSWLRSDEKNPLRLWVAIKLALIFQVAIIAITYVRNMWTVEGLYGSAVLLGLTNADALTVSMSTPSAGILPWIAAQAIALGILANTVVKLAISVAVGSGRFRLIAGGVLVLMAVAIGAPLALL